MIDNGGESNLSISRQEIEIRFCFQSGSCFQQKAIVVAVVLAVGIHSLLLKYLLQYSDASLVAVEDHTFTFIEFPN